MSYSTTSLIVTPKEVPSYYKRLSICLKPNGFSFSRITTQGTLLTFGEVAMNMERPLAELSAELKCFFAEQRISAFDFEDMTLVVPSNQIVWIPDELFSAGHEREYLESAYALPHGMGAFSTRNDAVGTHCVFAANTTIVAAFKIVLPGIEVCCQHCRLASQQFLQATQQSPAILMHQREGACDFVVCSEGRLLLSSTYELRTDEERLFRAIELMKTLKVETPKTTLLLCGDVGRETYASLKGYFPRIILYNGGPLRFINPEFQTLHTYRHVLVLS